MKLITLSCIFTVILLTHNGEGLPQLEEPTVENTIDGIKTNQNKKDDTTSSSSSEMKKDKTLVKRDTGVSSSEAKYEFELSQKKLELVKRDLDSKYQTLIAQLKSKIDQENANRRKRAADSSSSSSSSSDDDKNNNKDDNNDDNDEDNVDKLRKDMKALTEEIIRAISEARERKPRKDAEK